MVTRVLVRAVVAVLVAAAGLTVAVGCSHSPCAYAAEVAYPSTSGARSGGSSFGSGSARSSSSGSGARSGTGGGAPGYTGSRPSKAPTLSGSRPSGTRAGGSVVSSSTSRAPTFNGSRPEGTSTIGRSYSYAGRRYVSHPSGYYSRLGVHDPYDPYDPANFYNPMSPWFHYAVYAPC